MTTWGGPAIRPETDPMNVYIPTPLRSYTRESVVQADGTTLEEMFADLERRFPGIRFRVIDEQDEIRRHIRIFVNQATAQDLRAPLSPGDSVRIIMAISGG